MFHCSVAFLTSLDERGTVYTVRYHTRDSHVPTSVDFHDRELAIGFAWKMMALSLDDIAFHARKDGYYAHD